EDRVGIALEPMHRTAKTGRLYSSSHVRLRLGVKMVVGLSQDLVPGHLDETGLIGLGGEQRVARYAFMRNGLELPSGESNWIVALNHFPFKYLADMQWQDLPRVSGPLIRRGGWDMKRNFHKNTTAYLPAGTAINVQQGAEVPFGFIRI
ncbi:MAG: hypothetical protein FJY85_19850, partial [Deltaproteobacteria bacterium]|nr:hypothetical protein [Deltaproteobacteria bacterium]